MSHDPARGTIGIVQPRTRTSWAGGVESWHGPSSSGSISRRAVTGSRLAAARGRSPAKYWRRGGPGPVVATDASEQFVSRAREAIPRRASSVSYRKREQATGEEGWVSRGDLLARLELPPEARGCSPGDAVLSQRKAGSSLRASGTTRAKCSSFGISGNAGSLTRPPRHRQWDEGRRFPICSPSALEDAFQRAGFFSSHGGFAGVAHAF